MREKETKRHSRELAQRIKNSNSIAIPGSNFFWRIICIPVYVFCRYLHIFSKMTCAISSLASMIFCYSKRTSKYGVYSPPIKAVYEEST